MSWKQNGLNTLSLTVYCVEYLVIGGIVLTEDLLHKGIEAVSDALELLHRCVGQESKNRNKVCRVTGAHHLAKLVTEIHQAEQFLVVVVIASAKAHSADHICDRDNDVAEGVKAAVSLHDSVELLNQVLSLFGDVLLQHAAVLWGRALQGGEGAQGTVGQLSAGTPDASLVCAEGQTLAIIDKAEAG